MGRPVTYTTPATVSTGGTSTAAQFNAALRDNVTALASHAQLSFSAGTGVILSASTTAQVTGMVKDLDSADGMVDLVNQRIVCKQAGTYRILADAGAAPAGTFTLFVKKNSSSTLMSKGPAFFATIDYAFALAVNDYVELWTTNGNAFAITVLPPMGDGAGPDNMVFRLFVEWVAP